MKKTLLIVGIVLILLIGLVVLTGCGDEEKGLIGSWKAKYGTSEYIYKFNKDNTGSYSAFGNERAFKFEDKGTSVKITYDGDTTGSTYDYRIEGKKLIIKDSFGSEVVYEK